MREVPWGVMKEVKGSSVCPLRFTLHSIPPTLLWPQGTDTEEPIMTPLHWRSLGEKREVGVFIPPGLFSVFRFQSVCPAHCG